ncbi:MAG: hypothetical protein LBQ80_04875 [Clostridium sp.]|jgi:hypothetical protein|nr:hypothetical protein [Clostridium sp.]
MRIIKWTPWQFIVDINGEIARFDGEGLDDGKFLTYFDSMKWITQDGTKVPTSEERFNFVQSLLKEYIGDNKIVFDEGPFSPFSKKDFAVIKRVILLDSATLGDTRWINYLDQHIEGLPSICCTDDTMITRAKKITADYRRLFPYKGVKTTIDSIQRKNFMEEIMAFKQDLEKKLANVCSVEIDSESWARIHSTPSESCQSNITTSPI